MASLIESVLKNELEGLRVRLSHGADPNERDTDGRSPLIYAAIRGRSEIARLLFEHRVGVDTQDGLGYSALHYVAQNYFCEFARLLIRHAATVDVEDNHGNTPLGRAVFESQGRGVMISILLDAGADRNHQNKYGKTPMDLAKLIANYDVTQFFK